MLTLDELGNSYHISKRTIETNLANIVASNSQYDGLTYNGHKWLIDTNEKELVRELTRRSYAKHYVVRDNSNLVDEIDLTELVAEKDLRVFGTIAPKGIKSVNKMNHVVRDIFDYVTATDIDPTFFIYCLENNTDYLGEKGNRGYHSHFVTTAPYTTELKQTITEMLTEQIGSDKVNNKYTVDISPYKMGKGLGGLKYTLKYSIFTGAYIK